MAKLVLSMNGAVLGEFPLDKERISIGRKPDNDIQIDNLAVSGKHALIITILDDSFLEDLGSTNGTFVNDRKVADAVGTSTMAVYTHFGGARALVTFGLRLRRRIIGA